MISFKEYKQKQSIMENFLNFSPKINDFLKQVELSKNDTEFPVHAPTIDWFIEETKKYFFSNEETGFDKIKKLTPVKHKLYKKNSLSAEQRMDYLTDLFVQTKNNLKSYGSIEAIYNTIKQNIKEMHDAGSSKDEIIYYLTDSKYSSKFKNITDWNEFVKTIRKLAEDVSSEVLPTQKTMATFFNNFYVLMLNLPSNLDSPTLSEIQTYFLEKFAHKKGQKYTFDDGSIWSENNWMRTNFNNGVVV